MDREDCKATWKNLSARTAFLAAAAAAETVEPDFEGRHWWCCGLPELAAVMLGEVINGGEPMMRSQAIVLFTEFTLTNPTAPAESLFRFAAARGLHLWHSDDWLRLPLHCRIAFEVFHETLLVTERLFGATAQRMEVEDAAEATALRAAEPPKALPGLTGLVDRPAAMGGGLIKGKKKAARSPAA